MTVRCSKVNDRGNSSFSIDGKTAQFDPVLKVAKGTEVQARIKGIRDINRGIRAYILELMKKD